MIQTHSQITLTPKPINLDEVVKQVTNHKGGIICSYAGKSEVMANVHSSEEAQIAQATIARQELDDVLALVMDTFDVWQVSIHYRIGSIHPGDIQFGIAVLGKTSEVSTSTTKFLARKLSGKYESIEDEIRIQNNIRKQ